MKRLFVYYLLQCLFFWSFGNKVHAQTLSVSLSSTGNCIGSVLTANSNLNAQQIVWKQNGTVVQTTNAVFAIHGYTVAGGNGNGSGNNQLNNPFGLFVDTAGNVYVSDHDNNRIMKWAAGTNVVTGSGMSVAGNGTWGSSLSELALPNGVFVDSIGNVYVADYQNFRVVKWTPGASQGSLVAGGNGYGSAPSQIANPYGVYVNSAGNIYVADGVNNRVMKFTGVSTSTNVAGGNGAGNALNKLDGPQGFCVDASGNVYVADVNNHRVMKWAPGATSGTVVAGGYGPGTAANQLYKPSGVAVDAAGNIYVADYNNNRIQLWTPGATTGFTVAGDSAGTPGFDSTHLQFPTGVFVDKNGNIYVSDHDNERVQKFTSGSSIVNTFTPTIPGTYTATVYTFNGQNATTLPVIISAAPTITLGNSPSICSGTTIATLPYSAATGNPNTYNITYDPAAQAAGFINVSNSALSPSQIAIAVPGTLTPGVYNATLTVGASGGCTSASQNFTITVNTLTAPTINVSSSTVSNTSCAGSQVTFTATVTNGGTAPGYQWYINGNPVGTDSTKYSTGSLNNGDIVSCVLTSNSTCVTTSTATSNSISYTITPIPSMSPVSDQVACDSVLTNTIQLTGSSVAGTTYTWSNSNTSIGLPATGSGDITSFLAHDTSHTSAVIDTVTVTPQANGCYGAIQTFKITVNPTPSMNPVADQNACNRAMTNIIQFSGSSMPGISYVWTNTNTSIGLSSFGSGNIGSFIANDTSANASVTAIIIVTPQANGCHGINQSFQITVNPNPPVPVLDIKPSGAICSNNAPLNFGTTVSAPSGVSYLWSVSNALIWGVGTGNRNCLVSFPNPGSSVVTLSTVSNGSNCISSVSDSITVNNAVVTNAGVIYYNSQFVCLDNLAVSYQWGYDDAHTLMSNAFPGEVNQDYINANPDFANKYYWVIVTHDGCVQKIYFNAPTSINKLVGSGEGMKIYPNPATDIVNVEINENSSNNAEVYISDMTGKIMSKTLVYNNKCNVSINDLSPGLYIISCYRDHVMISASTLIKN